MEKMTQMMTFDEEKKTAVVPVPVVRLVAPPNSSATLVGMRWTNNARLPKVRSCQSSVMTSSQPSAFR